MKMCLICGSESVNKFITLVHFRVLAMVMVALGMFHVSAMAVNCPISPTVIPAGTTYSSGCVLNINGATLTIDGASGGASAGTINDAQGSNLGINTSIVNRGSITTGLVGINNDIQGTMTTLTN